jgi:tetratricopeptide (TPR) repeat protein
MGNAGDLAGAIAEIERSIEIALAVNSPEAARGYNNLSAVTWMVGDTERALRLREESIRAAERLGDPINRRYARACLPLHLYLLGQWDETVRLAEEIIEECEHDPHYGESFARRVRGLVRLACGDDAGALEDVRRAAEIARRARDPQTLLPALGIWFRVVAELRLDEADDAAEEMLRELAAIPTEGWAAADAFFAATERGRAADYRRALGTLDVHGPRWAAAWAILDEQYREAADVFARMGEVADEAYARLLAAEQHAAAGRRAEASAELDRALAFYRSVGATRYIRQAEALLAASA